MHRRQQPQMHGLVMASLTPARGACAVPAGLWRVQVSVQAFMQYRQYHEGQLTKRKELVVSNAALAERAKQVRGPRQHACQQT